MSNQVRNQLPAPGGVRQPQTPVGEYHLVGIIENRANEGRKFFGRMQTVAPHEQDVIETLPQRVLESRFARAPEARIARQSVNPEIRRLTREPIARNRPLLGRPAILHDHDFFEPGRDRTRNPLEHSLQRSRIGTVEDEERDTRRGVAQLPASLLDGRDERVVDPDLGLECNHSRDSTLPRPVRERLVAALSLPAMTSDIFARSAPGRRVVVALAMVTCCMAAGWLPLACGPVDESHPNVLLITIDTLRADHLGAYGFDFDVSPRIDALAEKSVVFERAIAASGKTAPSHAAIMTSGYTREHSIGHGNGTSRLSDRVTLAESFQEAGYATAAFVSNILLTRRIGFDRGFDVFDDELEAPESNRPDVVERLAPDTTARAIEWLDEQAERPFFLWVHYQDPHGPYTPPAEAAARFDIPGEPGESELPLRAGNQESGGIPPYQALPGLRRVSEYRGRYAGEIFFADEWIGRLLARVGDDDTRGTVTLLTADHGESFGEYGHYFKHTHTTTPDVAHVPLILSAPGLTPERRNDLVSHVDIAPTLLELAGLPAAAGASGVALSDRSGASIPAPERFVYCDNGGQLSAYRGDGFHWLVGVGSAWRIHEERTPLPFTPNSAFFRWNPSTLWRRAKGPVSLPAEVGHYAEHPTAMTPLAPPDKADLKKLRALGYVD